MRRWQAGSLAIIASVVLGAVSLQSASPAQAGVAPIDVVLDCDLGAGGIQTDCNPAGSPATVAVGAVLVNNSGAAFNVASFNFDLLGNNQPLFTPVVPTCLPPGFACNPDFNEGLAGIGWTCSPPPPNPDQDASGTATNSFISCNNAVDAPALANGASILLATVTYNVAGTGVGGFELATTNVFDAAGTEQVTCETGCNAASIQIGTSAATNTPTPPPTSTNTPVSTPTPCSGDACPTRTSLAFITVTLTASATVPPSATVPATGDTPVPGATQPGGGTGPDSGGGTGPITLPDTGTGSGSGDSSLLLAMASIGMAAVLGGGLILNLAGATARRKGN